MSDDNRFVTGGAVDDGEGTAALRASSTVMVAAVIFLFMIVVFVFFLYLYAKRYLGPSLSRRGSRRVAMFGTAELAAAGAGRGLEPAVLLALPVAVFAASDFKEGLECAVCLSELADGEKIRLLPKCNHGFHLECIDMWFQSQSTCPLCRCPVGDPVPDEEPVAPQAGPPSENAGGMMTFPTNILFWGSQDQVNTRNLSAAAGTPPALAAGDGSQSDSSGSSSATKPGGALVIEIPMRIPPEGDLSPMSPLPPSSLPMEEMKSPAVTPSRFRSLTRLLSRGKRAVGSSQSPRVADIEQGLEGNGEGSSRATKTPAS